MNRATATHATPQLSDRAGAMRPPPQKASAMPMIAATPSTSEDQNSGAMPKPSKPVATRIAVAFAAVAMMTHPR